MSHPQKNAPVIAEDVDAEIDLTKDTSSNVIASLKEYLYSIGAVVLGFGLLIASFWIDTEYLHVASEHGAQVLAYPKLTELGSKLCEHVGFALLVAVAVAVLFDKVYLKTTFIHPLNEVYKRVRNSVRGVRIANNEMKMEIIRLNRVLKSTEAENISAIFRRSDSNSIDALRKEIEEAITNADQFLYIQGNTFQKILVKASDDAETFGITAIKKRLKERPDLDVKICLTNTFLEQSDVKFFLRVNEVAESRIVVHDIIKELNQINSHRISLRFTSENPMYGLLMTEDCLFLEHYTLNSSSSSILVFKSLPSESHIHLYEIYKRAFEASFHMAVRCSEVLGAYLNRKRGGKGKPADNSALVAGIRSCHPIAQSWESSEARRRTP